jgi:hypothetical protein
MLCVPYFSPDFNLNWGCLDEISVEIPKAKFHENLIGWLEG